MNYEKLDKPALLKENWDEKGAKAITSIERVKTFLEKIPDAPQCDFAPINNGGVDLFWLNKSRIYVHVPTDVSLSYCITRGIEKQVGNFHENDIPQVLIDAILSS